MSARVAPALRCAALGLVGASLLTGLTNTGLQARSQPSDLAQAMMAPAGISAKGTFRKAEAPVSGGFVIRKEGGRHVLTLSSDFRTNAQAPDLKVAFSSSPTPLASSKPPAYPLKPGSYTVLAPLKSASGSQSYVIPASVDLSQQGSVLIWCQTFNATMAWAPLKP
jgi:Electron transfer DM13